MGRRFTALSLTLAAVASLAAAAGAQSPLAPSASSVAPALNQEVRNVIDAQLKAFATGDGAAAYAQATPAIRELFSSPQQFMAMVRAGYPVLLNPASVVFLQVTRVGEGPSEELVQAVQLTDAEGRSWLATYRLQRQADRSLRIGGCELISNRGRAT